MKTQTKKDIERNEIVWAPKEILKNITKGIYSLIVGYETKYENGLLKLRSRSNPNLSVMSIVNPQDKRTMYVQNDHSSKESAQKWDTLLYKESVCYPQRIAFYLLEGQVLPYQLTSGSGIGSRDDIVERKRDLVELLIRPFIPLINNAELELNRSLLNDQTQKELKGGNE